MKNIVVLGGGTAGYLTSLLVKRFYPDYNVTVVASSEIGILGAGEGTVPHFIDVLDFLGIPTSSLVKECSATLKLGVKFTNWRGKDTSYVHSFEAWDGLGFNAKDYFFMDQVIALEGLARHTSLDDVHLYPKLMESARVPFVYQNSLAILADPISRLKQHGAFALHFDARLLAVFLQKVAESRGVKVIDGVVDSVEGNITALTLTNGQKVKSDFVFDCSGFARLLVGKHFNTEWVSYEKHLPLNTALPFFIEHDGVSIKPQTEAIAMKYGWVWKIPVQNRYGCGYVFDSSYINEEQAKQEVEEYFGHTVKCNKAFKFKAGTFKDTVVNNVMAVGLAQSFIEPLEATSIWISTVNLISFLRDDGLNKTSSFYTDVFNEECFNRNKDVLEFIYVHYLTDRNDSEFWRNFKTNTEEIPRLNKMLDTWKVTQPIYKHIDNRLFFLNSWAQVADGCGLLNKEEALKQYTNLGLQRDDWYLKNQINVGRSCLDHGEFIQFLKERL